MTGSKTSKLWACSVLFLFSWLLCMAATTRGDTITLKNGMVYLSQGAPDKDATLVYIWDGLKKTVIRDSKIERVVGDNTYRTGEKFALVQPLVVHAGSMPREVLSVQAGPWNEKGRRPFRYVGSKSPRPTSMEQAIIEIGPHVVKYRGVNGFWLGQVATTQIPRPVVTGLLARVEQQDQAEREQVVRFLMDAGYYPEARQELDRIIHDFPQTDLSERAAGAKGYIIQAQATQRRAEIEVCRKAQQYRQASSMLRSFTEKEIATELLLEIRDVIRRDDEQRANDLALATDLRKLEGKLPATERGRHPVAGARAGARVPGRSRGHGAREHSGQARSSRVAHRGGRLRGLQEARPRHPDGPAHAASPLRPRRGGGENHDPQATGARERGAHGIRRSPASRVPPASFLPRDHRAALRARAAIGYRGLGG